METYINFNGIIYRSENQMLSIQNRAFRYGDALFETMHANGTEIQFFETHIKRLLTSMRALKMNIPPKFFSAKAGLDYEITRLLNRNKHYQGARVRVTVFRNDGGFYTPETQDVSFVIESEALKTDEYTLNTAGYKMTDFMNIQKPVNMLSNLKSANALLYTLAGIQTKDSGFDDCFIYNDKGFLCETISSNIFLVKKNVMMTPPLQDGCIDGVMRRQILRIAPKLGYDLVFEQSVKPSYLLSAEEVFITNAVTGIRWIGAYKERRYFNQAARALTEAINNELFAIKRKPQLLSMQAV